jgi:ubiquinone/menaquinone biosynthesis C-methylase UbiE
MACSLDRTPQGWDATVDNYDRIWAPFFSHFAVDALRLAGVRAGQRVLDVAAGPGTLTFLAARLGAEVVATDFAPAMIAPLRRHAADDAVANVTAEVMDGQALSLSDGSFDVACLMFGLGFFPDRAAGFRELHRVLKPGGTAAIGAWNGGRMDVFTYFQRAVRRALPDRAAPAGPPPGTSLADPVVLEREMRAAGFARVAVNTVTHTWETPTPEVAWQSSQGSSPVFATFREAERSAVEPVYLAVLREEFGNGPVRLDAEAHIGIGTK